MEMSTGQSVVIHCGWGSKAGWNDGLLSVCVAGKTEWFFVNMCHSERFREEYTHDKMLYECPVLVSIIDVFVFVCVVQNMVQQFLAMLASHSDVSLRFLSFRLDFNEHYHQLLSSAKSRNHGRSGSHHRAGRKLWQFFTIACEWQCWLHLILMACEFHAFSAFMFSVYPLYVVKTWQTRWKVLWESTNPMKAFLSPTLATPTILRPASSEFADGVIL